MSLYGALDKTKHFAEFDEPLDTNEGFKSPSVRKAEALANLGLTATATEINAAADTSGRLVVIPDAATYTMLAANSGKTHVVPNLTADITISLPAASAGLEYRFMYGGVAADAQDWIIDTGADANFYLGGMVYIDSDAGAGADEAIPVFPDGNSNSIVTILTPQGGTWVYLVSDGTNWYINGTVISASASSIAFTDQP